MTEQEALRILQVENGSSAEAIRESYLHLVKVWHPDRFEHDSRLRARADRTLREINEAYSVLQQRRSSPASAAADAGRSRPTHPSPPPPKEATDRNQFTVSLRRSVFAGVAFGALVAIAFAAWPSSPPSRDDAAEQDGPAVEDPAVAAPVAPQRSAVRPTAPFDEHRPLSGTGVTPANPRGTGSVAIVNHGSHDAALVLARDGVHLYATYLRAGEKVQIVGVAEGAYDVLLTVGRAWREDRFTVEGSFLARDEPLQVREVSAGERIDPVAATLIVPQSPSTAGFRTVEPFGVRLP